MLEGEISEINLVERLVELWREQFTGAIRFENDGIIKILYFKGGDVLSASTNDRDDSIDEILMRAGKVSREHVKQALAKRKESETLGDALLNLGFITRKELTWARRVQVVGVIRSISEWQTGSFTIVADYLPKRDEGTLFPLPQIIVELVVTDQDRAKFERLLDGGNAVFTRGADFDRVWPDLGLNEEADSIVAEIDGARNATEIGVVSGKETFNVYKLLHALTTLGILTRVTAKPQVSPQFSLDEFSSAGVADAADMWSTTAAPVAAASPMFELDDAASAPSLDLPPMAFDEQPLAPPPAYDLDASENDWLSTPASAPAITPDPSAVPLRESAAIPTPAPVTPARDASGEQWGFDEAQIETASRGAAPPPIPPPARTVLSGGGARKKPAKRTRSYGLVIALIALFVLAAAGYYGFMWWQGQGSEATAPVATRPATPAGTPAATTTTAGTPIPDPGTIVEETTTAPATVSATASAPATATPEPVPTVTPANPQQATAAPAPAVVTPAVVTPAAAASPLRDRYDAMAREYAANPTGNFTIQIQILCDPGNLDQLVRSGGSNVWFVPQSLSGRSCYRVFYGRFQDREAAQRALATVPAAIRDRNSAVKPVPR
jgi:hypothetical protein